MPNFIQHQVKKCSYCGNNFPTLSSRLYYCTNCGQALRVNLCDECKKQVVYYCPECNASKQHIEEDNYGCFLENKKGHGDIMDVVLAPNSYGTKSCKKLQSVETLLNDFQNWHGLTRDYKSAVRNCQKNIRTYLKDDWKVSTKTKPGTKSSEEYWEQINSKTENKATKHTSDLFNFYKKTFRDDGFNVVEYILELLKKGDKLYALSVADLYIELAVKTKIVCKATDNGKNSLIDQISGIRKFRNYIDNNFIHNITENGKDCDKVKNSIAKPLVHKIDGALALAREIGEENFIKMALRQSYFFSSEIVEERIKIMSEKVNNEECLPARKTTKEEDDFESYSQKINREVGKTQYGIFTTEQKNEFKIVRDKDGNANVRSLIKETTGFTACEGSESVFQNYTISHIWGRAYDPRYFTSLWNIVLVPDWANGLLDKDGEEGSLESKIKATYMSICDKLYSLKSKKEHWDIMKMSTPEIIHYKDSLTEKNISDITINVIAKRDCCGRSTCSSIRIVKFPFEK